MSWESDGVSDRNSDCDSDAIIYGMYDGSVMECVMGSAM